MPTTPKPPITVSPPPSGGGFLGDRQILVWLLDTILHLLEATVNLQPSPFPTDLQLLLKETWGEVEQSLRDAIAKLRNSEEFKRLYPRLWEAGLGGPMLRFKSTSLYLHSEKYVGEILTYPAKKGVRERLTKYARPVFKCMNSILGSPKDLLPGLEIVKEYKEHVEASVDALEQEK